MYGLSGQHHDALCRRQQLHPSVLRLAGVALGLIGFLVLIAHVLPPLASLSANDLDSRSLVWMLPLQAKTLASFEQIIQCFWTKNYFGKDYIVFLDKKPFWEKLPKKVKALESWTK